MKLWELDGVERFDDEWDAATMDVCLNVEFHHAMPNCGVLDASFCCFWLAHD